MLKVALIFFQKADELSTAMLDLGFPLSLNNPNWAGQFAHIGARDTENDCILRFVNSFHLHKAC